MLGDGLPCLYDGNGDMSIMGIEGGLDLSGLGLCWMEWNGRGSGWTLMIDRIYEIGLDELQVI